MKATQVILTAVAALGLASAAGAASIGVNYVSDRFDVSAFSINPGETAGVVPQQNWNNLVGGNVPATALTDDSGTLLATTASINTQWSNNSGTGNSTPDHKLMSGGTDTGGGPSRSNINGIPYDLYDVYVYYDGGTSSPPARFGEYTITPSGTGASTPQTTVGYDDGTFSGTFIQETGGQDGNYILFEGVSGENLEIEVDPTNPGVSRAPLNGYQIVEVLEVIPEPSGAVLMLVGAFGLIARRRR